MSTRIGYAAAFELRLQDIGFDSQELVWGALFALVTFAWLSSLLLVLVEPVFRIARSKLIAVRNAVLFVLALTASVLLQRSSISEGDAATFVLWTASMFLFASLIATISAYGYAFAQSVRNYTGIRRRLALIATLLVVPLSSLPGFILREESWRAVSIWGALVVVLLLLLFFSPLGVGVTAIGTTIERHDSPPVRVMVAACVLFAFLTLTIGALVATIPEGSTSGGPSLSGLATIEGVIVLAAAAQIQSVRSYIDTQIQQAAVAVVAVVSTILLLTGIACYYWGASVGRMQMRDEETGFAQFVGLHVSTVCVHPMEAKLAPAYEGIGLLLASVDASYLVWTDDDGTIRLPVASTTLTYVDSLDAACPP